VKLALCSRAALVIAAMASAGALAFSSASASAATSRAAAAAAPRFAIRLLDKYRTLMAAFQKPPNMIFTYAESHGGASRIVTGTHRVYRDASGFQRNETLEVNGASLHPPRMQTFYRSIWPYHADQFAVDADAYGASFVGIATVNRRRSYVYSVKRFYPARFEITELALDPGSGLPLRERYAVTSAGCNARGEIDFAAAGAYWLPTFVSAQCYSADPKNTVLYKDTIRFSDYLFPAAIPKDVMHPPGGG